MQCMEMNMKNLTALTGLIVLTFSQLTAANTLILPSPYEPDLAGILDSEFGPGNLQRIDDDMDQYWTGSGEITATAVAKYAGYSQHFGFINESDDFTSLLYVPYMDAQSNSFNVAESGSPFRFGLDPSGSPLFSSDASDNVFCGKVFCSPELDHMVSWLITDGEFAGDYILAWEDLKFLGDRDYNDLVVRLSGVSPQVVPVPAAAWLFGSGLIGLAAFVRRRN